MGLFGLILFETTSLPRFERQRSSIPRTSWKADTSPELSPTTKMLVAQMTLSSRVPEIWMTQRSPGPSLK